MDLEGGSGEFERFMEVNFTVFACLTYCYLISKSIPKGFFRFISVLPIISIFTLLPIKLSSLSLRFLAGFLIGWLANFKLLLFSFDMGPLSSISSVTLPLFISIACLPVKIKQNPLSPHDNQNITKSSNHDVIQIIKPPKSSTLYYYVIESLLLGVVHCVYEYKQYLPYPSIMMKFLYLFQMFFTIEILLAMAAALFWILFRQEVEPQYNNPFLSTSPQDLWGRRWNLVVSGILRSIVYTPVRRVCSTTWILGGESLGLYVAVIATFVVSGVMHELLFFYMGRMQPVWDVMLFFVLSGICLALEIAVKKALKGRWQLNRLLSNMLTLGFITFTTFRLLFPAFERIGVDTIINEEIATFAQLVKAMVVNSWV